MADLADGALPPLPVTPFALDEASAAFRHMMKARQIGKIVVSHQRVAPAPLTRPDGQYFVTGGLSGLGLEVAEWLVARGAKHISLVGRRGADSPDASAIVQRMTAAGATVSVAAVDVGDGQALGAFLTERRSSGPPLRGVVHAAGVIDDAALASQDWPRFERVLRPKVGGARNLDRLTRRGSPRLVRHVFFGRILAGLAGTGELRRGQHRAGRHRPSTAPLGAAGASALTGVPGGRSDLRRTHP